MGHVKLNHHAAAGLYYEEFVTVDPETDSEHQANWYADELLMDSRKIDLAVDSIPDVMRRFRVSEAMAVRRLRSLILEMGAKPR